MKKPVYTLSLFCFLFIYPLFLFSQYQCTGSLTEYVLNSNNIRASFFARGNKFTNGTQGGFLVPYPSKERLSTIFASSPWIGGFDDAGNLKLAVETYPGSLKNDYSVGPLSYIGTIVDSTCGKFDQAWTVNYEDIQRHMLDFYQDFKIDDTIASIFGWPARGNKYFKHYYGFELPDDNQGLAPFSDTNGNNLYDPDKGEYPTIWIAGYNYDPDQILWMVFNDLDTNGHKPLRFEIQLTAFAFHCEDNEILNNTIFNSYKIIDRALNVLDSVFFGFWTDYDLGCSEDDFIGSDSIRNTEFVYNADIVDGDVGLDCSTGSATYGGRPPIQSMTYLSHPMHSLIGYRPDSSNPLNEFNMLNGVWGDGHPMRPDSDGYNTTANLGSTKFLFHGDPRDSTSWSANNVLDEGTDVKVVSSVYLGRMDPGSVRQIVTAHMFHPNPGPGQPDQFTAMYNRIDTLLSFFSLHGFPCTPFQFCDDNDCVWPGDFNGDNIVDPFDLLYWGVMKDAIGSLRNGLVSWRGQYADEWSSTLPAGVNFKHGDGNGDGQINFDDLDIYGLNYDQSNRFYIKGDQYIPGDGLIISADDIDSTGRIRHISVKANHNFDNVYGLSFELEFDTSIFKLASSLIHVEYPVDTLVVSYNQAMFHQGTFINSLDFHYGFVGTEHTNLPISESFGFINSPFGLRLKSGLTNADIPDSTILCLKNLLGLDSDGNDLHLGSECLVVHKQVVTGYQIPDEEAITIYPNPTHDLLYVDTPLDISGEIINLQGQSIQKVHLKNDSPLDVSGLTSGIYLLRIFNHSCIYKIVIY